LASHKSKVSPIVFDPCKKYTISFNCMRNGLETPIAYALGCVYSLYDLAETGLEVYHTHLDSYTEVADSYRRSVLAASQSKQLKQQKEAVSSECQDVV
jgi:hypothetical protein